MSTSRCIIGAGAAMLALVAARPVVDACVPVPANNYRSVATGREGVVILRWPRAVRAEERYDVVIEGVDGAPIAATVEALIDRLVWRPTAPLPAGTYRAHLDVVERATGAVRGRDDFEVVVSDVATPGVDAPPVIDSVEADETAIAAAQQCCDPSPDSCGVRIGWNRCWVIEHEYVVDVTVTWRVPAGADDRMVYRVRAPDGARALLGSFDSSSGIGYDRVEFTTRPDRYCATIEARDLVHDVTTSVEACTDRFTAIGGTVAPGVPDIDQCFGDIVDPATGDVVIEKPEAPPPQQPPVIDEVQDDGSCHAGGGAPGLLVASAAALLRRRRRR